MHAYEIMALLPKSFIIAPVWTFFVVLEIRCTLQGFTYCSYCSFDFIAFNSSRTASTSETPSLSTIASRRSALMWLCLPFKARSAASFESRRLSFLCRLGDSSRGGALAAGG